MYTYAAIVYVLAAFALCGFIWWQTRNFKFAPIKNILRFWPAILFFVPAYIVEGEPELAPAFLIVLFKTLTEGWPAAAPTAAPIVAAISISGAVIIIVPFVNWVRRPKPETAPATASDSQE